MQKLTIVPAAIAMHRGKLEIRNTEFLENEALYGAAISARGSSTGEITDSRFEENTAARGAGELCHALGCPADHEQPYISQARRISPSHELRSLATVPPLEVASHSKTPAWPRSQRSPSRPTQALLVLCAKEMLRSRAQTTSIR